MTSMLLLRRPHFAAGKMPAPGPAPDASVARQFWHFRLRDEGRWNATFSGGFLSLRGYAGRWQYGTGHWNPGHVDRYPDFPDEFEIRFSDPPGWIMGFQLEVGDKDWSTGGFSNWSTAGPWIMRRADAAGERHDALEVLAWRQSGHHHGITGTVSFWTVPRRS